MAWLAGFLGLVGLVVAGIAILARRRDRRRSILFRKGLDAEHQSILKACVPLSRPLQGPMRSRFEGLVALFLAEKTFVGCRGVVVNEVMRTTVAGHACLLLLGLRDLDVYPELSTIYLYPSTYVRRDEWALEGLAVVREEDAAFDGESWDRSAVVLSLAAVRHGVARFDGFNVVLHEFAHQFDALDGASNGCPPMDRSLHAKWTPAMLAAWQTLVEDSRRGRETFLDPYGAENPAEFFAVLVECFFELPSDLRAEHPDLHGLLCELFGYDPAVLHLDSFR